MPYMEDPIFENGDTVLPEEGGEDGDNDQTIPEILRGSIDDLIELARKHETPEAEIDAVLFELIAERLEGEEDEYIMRQFRIAKADYLRDQFKVI